jgi:dTDP-4-dehydrorhamnose reductase
MGELELWGGHECTVNRVGEVFHDQTRRSGHQDRISDLDLFADLGLKALRYPVLWERTAPDRPDQRDWSWSDARLARLRTLNIRPVVGLVHHGSGPAYTSLVDDGFAAGLAAHARAVAERYAHIEDWTPVNEPLTTARFACLYGHWYPHATDERQLWLALLNQIDATRLAMREVRRVNPAARLVQTEDLGRTYATAPLARQAEFENERRWLTWDLLCGRVTPDHPFWERIAAYGFGDRLRAIAEDPCPPDVIGVNHYLTSERFLDHRVEDYPPERRGGNDETAYADVEAIRALLPAPEGLEGVLQEAWMRYGRTLAVTESHNGCTRDEQIRWVREAWETALRLRERGVDLAAVTAWALLGSYDWNSLLTRQMGHYESGAFDLRGPQPRPTALAAALKGLATGADTPHPAAEGPGWWRRDIRLEFRPVFRNVDTPEPRREWLAPGRTSRPVLIAGATGTLGKALARACEWRGLDYVLTDRSLLALDDADSIARCLDARRPWAVINAAGWVRVDEAEAEEAGCMEANADGAVRLAQACAERDVGFVGFSSDLVFDGTLDRPYLETDPASPLNAYGRSKAKAEAEILALGRGLMVRTAAFFSPFDPHNFAVHVQRNLALGREVSAPEDLTISPTYVPDLVEAVLDLAVDGEHGLWHLANQGAVSWAEFARMIARTFGFSEAMICGAPAHSFGWPARRPPNVALASARGALLPSLENALARHAALLRAADYAWEAEARADREAPAAPMSRSTSRNRADA